MSDLWDFDCKSTLNGSKVQNEHKLESSDSYPEIDIQSQVPLLKNSLKEIVIDEADFYL